MGFFGRIFGKGPRPEAFDYQQYLDASMEGLKLMNSAHQSTWHLGEAERWNVDQESGMIVFSFEDGTIAQAKVQIIGSLSNASKTWLWSWANPSVLDHLKQDSLKVREFGQEHGVEQLIEAKWEATESDGWEMAAIAARVCGANGAYRGPTGSGFVFMTFGAVKLSKSVS